MNVPTRVKLKKKEPLVRLQEDGQSGSGGKSTGQKLAGSEAKGTAGVTLSGSAGGRTDGAGGRSSRALGRGRRHGRNEGRGCA